MRHLSLRVGVLAATAAAAAVVVVGCGGGGDGGDTAADAPAEAVAEGADVRPSVLVLGRGDGFVAQTLGAAMKAGSATAFDVLVVDGQAGPDARSSAQAAIEAGKRVVIDGAGAADAELVRELAGMSVEAEAVMVTKSRDGDGYFVVPIDSASGAAKRKAAMAVAGASTSADDPPNNTVQNVFGL